MQSVYPRVMFRPALVVRSLIFLAMGVAACASQAPSETKAPDCPPEPRPPAAVPPPVAATPTSTQSGAPGAPSAEIAPKNADTRAPAPSDAAAFNAWIDGASHPEDLPRLVAQAFANAEARSVSLAVNYASGEAPIAATVTVTLDGLLDDSVRGEEHVLAFRRDPESRRWRLEKATSKVRCWSGRGHADFSTAPCI
jgi:hypothetical protein